LWKEYSGADGNDFEFSWPEANDEFLKFKNFQLIIQVNGKVRGRENVPADITQEEAQEIALQNENVKKILSNSSIKKVIYVKKKLINFVI
jgi:leucyl-tRNA synthetase